MLYTHNFRFNSLLLNPLAHMLFAVLCCMAFASVGEAQTFIVPGTAGHNWVDTGLNIAPGTFLQFSAEGQVNVGYDWGIIGPEGTPHFAEGRGYPSEDQPKRYGLVARFTGSPTSPHTDIREDWTYREGTGHIARHGGHLWLTVNDNDPANNTGYFTVKVETMVSPEFVLVCKLCPWEFDLEHLRGDYSDPKTFNGVLVFGGSITDVKESAGMTLVTVSPGTVVAKYGDLPKLKIVFETNAAAKASPAKQDVIQGIRFDDDKMSLINGKAPLELRPQPNTKPWSQPLNVRPASRKAH